MLPALGAIRSNRRLFFRLLICAAVARYPAEQEGIVRYSLNLVRIPPQSAVIWCESRTFQLRSYLDPCATTEAHRNTIALCRPPPRHNPTDWQVVYDGAHGSFSLLHIPFPPYVSVLAWGCSPCHTLLLLVNAPRVYLSFAGLILLYANETQTRRPTIIPVKTKVPLT